VSGIRKKTPAETFNMLKETLHKDKISQTTVYELHKIFSEGRTKPEDNEGRGRKQKMRSYLLLCRIRPDESIRQLFTTCLSFFVLLILIKYNYVLRLRLIQKPHNLNLLKCLTVNHI